jgi:hypothetical protein
MVLNFLFADYVCDQMFIIIYQAELQMIFSGLNHYWFSTQNQKADSQNYWMQPQTRLTFYFHCMVHNNWNSIYENALMISLSSVS